MSNAQLNSRERTVVYIDAETDRILGFCPEMAKPMIPKGVKVKSETLYHASDIERWAKRFRAEEERDREERTYRQVMREAPARKAISDALEARSRHLPPAEAALNRAIQALMDQRYQRVMADKMKVESYIAAEKYEEGARPEDIAFENPVIAGKIQ